MSLSDLLLLIIVIAGAVYAGYVLGRRSVLNERYENDAPADEARSGPRNPLPGPSERLDLPRRTGAPPPASAGGEPAGGPVATGQTQPRRSSAPPPARAGLLGTADGAPGNDANSGPAKTPKERH